MRPDGKTLVTIATYNEIENLPLLVDAILERVPEVDVLVIDDNSPDGTGRWCDERGQTDPRVRCLHRSGKLGLSGTVDPGESWSSSGDRFYLLVRTPAGLHVTLDGRAVALPAVHNLRVIVTPQRTTRLR